MINHARTLLLNASATQNPGPGFLGEEFVPVAFTPIDIPNRINRVRDLIFGANPDRAMRNYRLLEIMTMLHSTELEKFLLDLDPRVTYWPPRERGIFDETFGVVVNPLQTDLESTLSVLGTLDPTVGRLFEQWTIHVTGATTVSIRKDTPISSTDTATLVVSGGLSAPLSLQDSSLDFVISNPTAGYKYIVTTLARPKNDLAILAERLKTSIGAATEAELFYQTAEPFQTFSNLWFEHDQLAYKLGGLLLALIYRIEDLRLHTVVST